MTRPLKLFIGSGNLGNAEPDTESIAAWVPDDGNCAEVLDQQKYSIVTHLEDFDEEETRQDCSTSEEDNFEDDNIIGMRAKQLDQFDIIVMGLQESTFEPDSDSDDDTLVETKVRLDLSEDSEKEQKTSSASTDRSSKVLTESMQQVAKQAGKAAKTAGKAAKTAGKAAKTSATQVAKVGAKGAEKVDKAARKGVATVNTLTANREHKKDTAPVLVSDGTSELHQLFQERLPSYTRLLSFQRGEMRLLIFSRERHHTVTIKSVRAQNTGVAGLANKGGIVSEVVVDEGTVLAFMSCHLEAHEGISKYAARCSSLSEILKGTKKFAIPSIYPDCSLAAHFCFVLGDLNFRTRHKGRIKSEEQLEDVTKLVDEKNWKELNEADELRMALEKQECLHGFQTLLCNFNPTFKVERCPGYKYKAQRTPSYTDRILWRTGDQLEKKIIPLAYEPIDDFATSDHKPIRGAFEIQLNRRVFLRKREQHALKGVRASVFSWKGHGDSSRHENLHLFVCDIQCDIFPNSEWSSKPDSYVCLVSSPEDILLKKPTKMKQLSSAMRKFLRLQDIKVDSDEQSGSGGGWPRTGKIKNTNNPDWTNREIHCILKTHREDGSPINLTGAILHIFLFKHNGRQTDEVIGSYPINLENIFRSCTLLSSHSMRTTWRSSVKRKSFNSIRDAQDNIVSVDINGPLLKNGRQTGVLRCTVDAWWINDTIAAINEGAILNPNDQSEVSIDGSEGSNAMFSSRKSSRRK